MSKAVLVLVLALAAMVLVSGCVSQEVPVGGKLTDAEALTALEEEADSLLAEDALADPEQELLQL